MRHFNLIRMLFAIVIAAVTWVTWQVNGHVPPTSEVMSTVEIEAVIVAGKGEILHPAKAFDNSLKDVVMFRTADCPSSIYLLPGALHNEANLYLIAVPNLKLGDYESVLAYQSDVMPSPGVLLLYLRQLKSDLARLVGATAPANSRYALFFLVPDDCDIRTQFDWPKLWRPVVKTAA